MGRITKKPDERKQEIIECAVNLFYEKGFFNTAVSDIVKKLDIAQGTFYYYFKTKEEILDFIVNQYIDYIVNEAELIVKSNATATEKIKEIFVNEFKKADFDCDSVSKLHLIKDFDLHQRILIRIVERYVPVLVKIVKQGIKERVFKTKYPLEATEILILGFHFLLDPGITSWDEKGMLRRIKSSGEIIENTLIAKKGSFGFLPGLLNKYMRSYYELKKNFN